MKIIDTHAHLYAKEFDEDRDEMIQKSIDQGVSQIYLPNIDSSSIEAMLTLEATYPEHCVAMMGLHPCYVKENYKEELKVVQSWLNKRPFCAIGEIGIDLYWDKTFVKEQEEAFYTQAQWALDLDIPIVIHSRDATDYVIQLLKNINNTKLRGIFHCFTGTLREAELIIELGFYLGIGGVVTFKNAGLDKTVAELDLDNLVLETDAPYLAPKPYRGKRNESAYTRLVAEKVAAVKGVSLEEVATITTQNALSVFQTEKKVIDA